MDDEKPRRRGRPKKTFQADMPEDEVFDIPTNELILFLPIHLIDLEEQTTTDTTIEETTENEKPYEYNDRIYTNLKTPYIEIIEGKTKIEEPTKIACWWCSYNFETIPCFIPERYMDNKFYVFGCFCCVNCAISYIFSMNDYKVWDRYSLLKKMYSFLIKNNELIINQNREILEKFGGSISIEEWRKNSILCTKEYKLIMPPMIPIIPVVEIKKR